MYIVTWSVLIFKIKWKYYLVKINWWIQSYSVKQTPYKDCVFYSMSFLCYISVYTPWKRNMPCGNAGYQITVSALQFISLLSSQEFNKYLNYGKLMCDIVVVSTWE